MSNKLKNQFTSEMIKKSKATYENDKDIYDDLERFLNKDEQANLTPQQRSKEIMYVMQEGNVLRPEILLDRDHELSKLAFPDDASFNSFEQDLSQYQDDEQILTYNRKHGAKINDGVLDETKLMTYRDPKYIVNVDDEHVKKTEKLIDKAYENAAKNGQTDKYHLFSNSNAILSDVDIEGLEEPNFKPFDVSSELELPINTKYSMMIGDDNDSPEFSNMFKNLDKLAPTPENLEEPELNPEEELVLKTRKKRLAEIMEERFSGDERIKDTIYNNGQRVMTVKESRMSKRVTAYLGMTPSSENITKGFLKANPKTVSQFPLSDENLASFKASLEDIRDNELFDINDIKISKKVDPAFQMILDQVKGQTVAMGQELDNDIDEQEQKVKEENKADKPTENLKDETTLGKDVDVKPELTPDEPKENVDSKPEEPKQDAKAIALAAAALAASDAAIDKTFNTDDLELNTVEEGYDIDDFDEEALDENDIDQDYDSEALDENDIIYDDEIDEDFDFEAANLEEQRLDNDIEYLVNRELYNDLEFENSHGLVFDLTPDKSSLVYDNVADKENGLVAIDDQEIVLAEIEPPRQLGFDSKKTALENNDDTRQNLLADLTSDSKVDEPEQDANENKNKVTKQSKGLSIRP